MRQNRSSAPCFSALLSSCFCVFLAGTGQHQHASDDIARQMCWVYQCQCYARGAGRVSIPCGIFEIEISQMRLWNPVDSDIDVLPLKVVVWRRKSQG